MIYKVHPHRKWYGVERSCVTPAKTRYIVHIKEKDNTRMTEELTKEQMQGYISCLQSFGYKEMKI